jgi:hypothetical protein
MEIQNGNLEMKILKWKYLNGNLDEQNVRLDVEKKKTIYVEENY